MCALPRIYITCTSTNSFDVPELPLSRPGKQPLVTLLCGFFWRSNRNHYLLVLVMRALATSIHVRTYVPKTQQINALPLYLPRYHGDLFYSKYYMLWDKIGRQFENNVLPSFILSASPYIKIRRVTGEYRSKSKILRTSRLSRPASNRVHVEVRNGQGRAGGVAATPRRRRSNEAI